MPRIGRIRLAKLQSDDLDGLYVELLRDGNRRGKAGGGLSPASGRYVHRVLRKALGDAHHQGIVSRNVATQADPPSPAATAETEAMHVWDAAELRHFLDVTAAHRHHVLFTIAARTGMRRGEVLALYWHDIDFDRSTITIRRSLAEVGWDLQFTDVKTRAVRRTINISGQALDALRRHREAGEEAADDAGQRAGVRRA